MTQFNVHINIVKTQKINNLGYYLKFKCGRIAFVSVNKMEYGVAK